MTKDNFEVNEPKTNEARAAANILGHFGETEKKSKKKSNSDYIRLDVADYKEYLRTMSGYDSMKTGKTVSVTKYIQKLIDADMQARKSEYEKAKNI
jgi:hypothetical protein